MNTMTATTAVPSIPAGRLQSVNLRAQLLWTARFRVLWILAAFALITLIALLRIASLGLAGQTPQRTRAHFRPMPCGSNPRQWEMLARRWCAARRTWRAN